MARRSLKGGSLPKRPTKDRYDTSAVAAPISIAPSCNPARTASEPALCNATSLAETFGNREIISVSCGAEFEWASRTSVAGGVARELFSHPTPAMRSSRITPAVRRRSTMDLMCGPICAMAGSAMSIRIVKSTQTRERNRSRAPSFSRISSTIRCADTDPWQADAQDTDNQIVERETDSMIARVRDRLSL